MFTNYAPASEAAYEKSGLFSYHLERKGLRFYNAINLFELYEERGLNRSKKLALFIMNVIFKVASTVKNILFQKYPLKNIVGEESPIFIKQKHSIGQSFFSRSESEFNWIFNKPWLIANQNTDPSYPFSWKVNSFTYSFVSFQSQTQSDSFLLFSVREGKVKVLYWKCNENEFDILAKWLVNYCYANKVKILTIVDAKFAACVNQIRNPFVWSKNISMNIYATFDFNAQQLSVYDGDGDYVFT
jgi:hypothetical protein